MSASIQEGLACGLMLIGLRLYLTWGKHGDPIGMMVMSDERLVGRPVSK